MILINGLGEIKFLPISLIKLNLRENNLTLSSLRDKKNLNKLTNLEELNLSANKIEIIETNLFQSLTSLKVQQ